MEGSQLPTIDRNVPYTQKVYSRLKKLILTNQLKPGEIINERDLATSLGVSRTPVQMALRILEKENWIERRGKTTRVSLITWENILSLIEVRQPLELLCYDLFVPKVTDEDIEELRKIVNDMYEMAQTGKPYNYYELMEKDTEFHMYMAGVTENPYVIQIISNLKDQLVRTSVLSFEYGGIPLEEYAHRHRRLLQTIEERDFAKGREALITHIKQWESHLYKIPERENTVEIPVITF